MKAVLSFVMRLESKIDRTSRRYDSVPGRVDDLDAPTFRGGGSIPDVHDLLVCRVGEIELPSTFAIEVSFSQVVNHDMPDESALPGRTHIVVDATGTLAVVAGDDSKTGERERDDSPPTRYASVHRPHRTPSLPSVFGRAHGPWPHREGHWI